MAEPQIIIGRLKKRIAKLTQQREHFKERCKHYAEVIALHPSREIEFRNVMERRKERERVQGLEQRIKEQALLIEKLTAGGGVEGK